MSSCAKDKYFFHCAQTFADSSASGAPWRHLASPRIDARVAAVCAVQLGPATDTTDMIRCEHPHACTITLRFSRHHLTQHRYAPDTETSMITFENDIKACELPIIATPP